LNLLTFEVCGGGYGWQKLSLVYASLYFRDPQTPQEIGKAIDHLLSSDKVGVKKCLSKVAIGLQSKLRFGFGDWKKRQREIGELLSCAFES
jgi:hypothetical protein